MFRVNCCLCGNELDEPGALAFSPPSFPFGMVDKFHVCKTCWWKKFRPALLGQVTLDQKIVPTTFKKSIGPQTEEEIAESLRNVDRPLDAQREGLENLRETIEVEFDVPPICPVWDSAVPYVIRTGNGPSKHQGWLVRDPDGGDDFQLMGLHYTPGPDDREIWYVHSPQAVNVVEHVHGDKAPWVTSESKSIPSARRRVEVPHTHAWGSIPHSHILRAICRRSECEGFPTHNIHTGGDKKDFLDAAIDDVKVRGDGTVLFGDPNG